MEKSKKSISPTAIILGVLLAVYAIVIMALLYWGIITAMKHHRDYFTGRNYLGLPRLYTTEAGPLLAPWEWAFGNFLSVAQYFDIEVYRQSLSTQITVKFPMQAIYTVLYSVGCAFFATLCPCIVAYATQKFKYGFNKVVDVIVIISMTVPIIGAQASMLSLMHGIGIYDSFLGLYMQKFNFGNMYYLMFSAIFKGVSKEYYEAGCIDGASEWKILTRIAIPLILTSFGLVFLLNFITYWNDYNTLLIYAPSHPTIAYGLFKVMTDSPGDTPRGQTVVQMAGCMMITMPVLALFVIFRNKLMGNLTLGGVKE